MPKRYIPPFYLAVICEEAKLFYIKGPMSDDTKESNEIGELAGQGFSIRCFTCGEGSTAEGDQAVLGIYPNFTKATSYDEVVMAAKALKNK